MLTDWIKERAKISPQTEKIAEYGAIALIFLAHALPLNLFDDYRGLIGFGVVVAADVALVLHKISVRRASHVSVVN